MKTNLKTTLLACCAVALSLLSACAPIPKPYSRPGATATPAPAPSPSPSQSEATPIQSQTEKSAQTAAASASTAISKVAECSFGDYKSATIAAINVIRSRPQVCGSTRYPAVGPLVNNAQLESAASVHSADMARNNHFEHKGTNGSSARMRVTATGYTAGKSRSMVGENIGAGQTSAAEASADWLASPGHCANMMTASFLDVGVSCWANPRTEYGYFWTLVLGNR